MHGIAMASALYGTVLGSLLGGWPTDRFGRKATLLWIGVLYLVSAVGLRPAPRDVYSFIAARFIGGLGIGISTVAAPLYISEIAPPAYRGRLAGMFQFNIVFGILIAFAVQRAARRHRRERLALDARASRRSRRCSTPCCASAFPKARAGCSGGRATAQAGLKVLRLIEPEASAAEIEADADEIMAASSEQVAVGAFLDAAAARARSCSPFSSPSSTSSPASTPSSTSRRASSR